MKRSSVLDHLTPALAAILVLFWCHETALADPSPLSINEALPCRAVENRLPIETDPPFEANDEPLYVWMSVRNLSSEEQELVVRWTHISSSDSFERTLTVGPARRWRTWTSYTMTASSTGIWQIEMLGPDGALLDTLEVLVLQQDVAIEAEQDSEGQTGLPEPSTEPTSSHSTSGDESPVEPQSGTSDEVFDFSINEAVICREVVQRVPQGTAPPFQADGERLYVWLSVRNMTYQEQFVTVRWINLDTGREFSRQLAVNHSRNWRTWASNRMTRSNAGRWRVEVFGPDQSLLTQLEFSASYP